MEAKYSPLLDLVNSDDARLVKQGAEARVYKTRLFIPHNASATATTTTTTVLIKHRFPKTYRHPTLDRSLTKSRMVHECRSLVKAYRSGVTVPQVRSVDYKTGCLAIEWLEGWTVREILGGGTDGLDDDDVDDPTPVWQELEMNGLSRHNMLEMAGEQLAKMHVADIIHGDLTTSNMMIRCTSHPDVDRDDLLKIETPLTWELVLIDFGLSQISSMIEDKAVDLYVLERAFASTHPEPNGTAEDMTKAIKFNTRPTLYTIVEEAYARGVGSKEWAKIRRRLQDVRLRGRKRSMVG